MNNGRYLCTEYLIMSHHINCLEVIDHAQVYCDYNSVCANLIHMSTAIHKYKSQLSELLQL